MIVNIIKFRNEPFPIDRQLPFRIINEILGSAGGAYLNIAIMLGGL